LARRRWGAEPIWVPCRAPDSPPLPRLRRKELLLYIAGEPRGQEARNLGPGGVYTRWPRPAMLFAAGPRLLAVINRMQQGTSAKGRRYYVSVYTELGSLCTRPESSGFVGYRGARLPGSICLGPEQTRRDKNVPRPYVPWKARHCCIAGQFDELLLYNAKKRGPLFQKRGRLASGYPTSLIITRQAPPHHCLRHGRKK